MNLNNPILLVRHWTRRLSVSYVIAYTGYINLLEMNFTYRDLALAILSAFLGSVKGYLVSEVKSLGAIEIFGIRSIGATCFILPIIIFYSYKLWYTKTVNLTLFMRSVVGNVAVCGYYYGFVNLPIAEASLLFYSTPIFTIIIGHLFLKELCGSTEIISTLLSVCGVCIVCVPEFSFHYSTSTVRGVVGCLVGALAQAIALAFIRKITQIPPFIVSFWWAAVGILFSAGLGGTLREIEIWQCGWEAMCLATIAVVGFVSEISLVSALKSTDAVIVSLALTSEIIWAFILQFFVCNEVPSLTTIIGGAVIGISLLIPPLVKFSRKSIVDSEVPLKAKALYF